MDQFVDKTKRAIKRGCAEIGIRKYASLSSMSAKHTKTAGAAPAEPAATNTIAKPTADSAFVFASVLTASQPLAAESTATQTTHAARKPSGSLRKYPAFDTREASTQELSSEATVILLHSDYTVQEDDEDEEEEEEKGNVSIGISTTNTSTYKRFTAGASVLESQMTIIAPSSPIRLPALVEGEETFETEASQFSVKALQPVVITEYTDLSETFTDLAELLFSIEGKYNVGLEVGLSRHPKLSLRMRPILVDWLSEVAADYRMYRQTLHLTVQYLDRFLTHTSLVVDPSMLQCYGTACLSIAMKAEEHRVPSLSELTDFSKDAFTRDQLKQAEIDVLTALGWHLAAPTIFEFLSLTFQRAALEFPSQFADPAILGELDPEWRTQECPAAIARRFDARQFAIACDYADALLHCQNTQRFLGSELAAACFYLGTTPNSLDGTMFKQCTGYSFVDVWPAILHVKRIRAALDTESASSLCAKQCCETKDRYVTHYMYIRPAELWAMQPHHAHLLGEFEDAFAVIAEEPY
ncbi:G1/S-specific cyclin-E1 [Kickxella alabastrina]|uniref:G1/S-specific cyclin-E1 n=1 Tax=Kickxella alabastrina TaxID=61397 RepID=A0ACC1IBP2_9FUNG|nr:G1/S-specific cyclin-E1 [Kickxella alabastrina]